MSIIDHLRDFIQDEFLPGDRNGTLDPEDDLLAEGLLDSIVVFQLVEFMERTYGIRIEDPEITEDNFRDLASMARLVKRRLEGTA